ncbi:MAG: thiolase family protein [Betaproteobacteria bacterium]|nr:MAG: thiolase family protein [Betaproteobacteria bacterium]
MQDLTPTHAAIVGIGESRLGVVPDRSALQLQSDAANAALHDAGLTLADIDGLITTPVRVASWGMPCGVVASYLGVRPSYLSTLDLAGASGAAMIHHAAMAIAAGQCTTVLCVAGQNLLSNRSRASAVQSMAESGGAHAQFEVPYGPLIPSLYALIAQRHMYEYGTTSEQMAKVAVTMREHASLNPNAHMREPISVETVLASRMITSPLKLLDCALVSDGAAAAIVTGADRARTLRRPPVYLLGQGYGLSHSHVGEYRQLTRSGAVESGRAAFASAGISPADIDVAELYDCFTITVIVELEDLGFCPKGEGGRFVADGHIGLRGSLPTTTHGGLLSAGHPGLGGGFFHVLEAVRQLRGEAGARQVEGAEIALAHGNGGAIAIHCTLILGGPNAREGGRG